MPMYPPTKPVAFSIMVGALILLASSAQAEVVTLRCDEHYEGEAGSVSTQYDVDIERKEISVTGQVAAIYRNEGEPDGSRTVVKITPRLIASDSWITTVLDNKTVTVNHLRFFIDRVTGLYSSSGESESGSGEKHIGRKSIGSCRKLEADVDLKDEAGILSVSCKIRDQGPGGGSRAIDYDINVGRDEISEIGWDGAVYRNEIGPNAIRTTVKVSARLVLWQIFSPVRSSDGKMQVSVRDSFIDRLHGNYFSSFSPSIFLSGTQESGMCENVKRKF